MSFATLETSAESGRPLELLMVTYLTNYWYFTTSELPVIHDGNTYQPLPFRHSDIERTGDVAKSDVTIEVPQDCPLGDLFRIQPPSSIVNATLFAKHVDDAEVKVVWKGRIVNAQWNLPWLKLTTESIYTSLRRVGLRRKIAVLCPHTVYQQGHGLCNANKAAMEVNGTAADITGSTIAIAATAGRPDNYFAAGEIWWTNADNGQIVKRMIVSSDNIGTVTLAAPPLGLAIGGAVKLYPGCNHTPGECNDKFGNKLNYGGQEYIPKKNPFGGSMMY